MINQKNNRKKYSNIKKEEFDKLLNSFYFTNWNSRLNKSSQKKIYELITDYNININQYMNHIETLVNQKNINKKDNNTIRELMQLLNILKKLSFFNTDNERRLKLLTYNYERNMNGNIS